SPAFQAIHFIVFVALSQIPSPNAGANPGFDSFFEVAHVIPDQIKPLKKLIERVSRVQLANAAGFWVVGRSLGNSVPVDCTSYITRSVHGGGMVVSFSRLPAYMDRIDDFFQIAVFIDVLD